MDAIRQAYIPAGSKRALLQRIWREAGAEALLSIGQGITSVGYDPIWHAAVRSASPEAVLEKWRRCEVFGHSKNRLRIRLVHERCATFRRYMEGGGTPTAPENLLICGLIIALLEESGCLGLRCDMPLNGGGAHRIREDGRFSLPADAGSLATGRWRIEWRSFSSRLESAAAAAEPPDVPLPGACEPALRALIRRLVRLLAADASRPWKVQDLAREAGLSGRTLQRRLHKAALSFSQLVRLVRIHEACRLLKIPEVPITAIGFCAGFSDSAHFSRDFRASMGMTPSDYRQVWRGERPLVAPSTTGA